MAWLHSWKGIGVKGKHGTFREIAEMIPDIEMTVPVPVETEYAASPVAIEPSYRRKLVVMKHCVSLEYAAFLIDTGELHEEEYIERIHECFDSDFRELEENHGEGIAFQVIDRMIRNEVTVAVKNNRSFDFADWV